MKSSSFHKSLKILQGGWGLKPKIVFASILIIFCAAAVISVYFIYNQKIIFQDELKTRANSLARNLAFNCEFPVLLEDLREIRQLAGGIMNDGDVSFLEIINEDQKTLLSLKKTDKANKILSGLSGNLQTDSEYLALDENGGFLIVSVPVWKPSEPNLLNEADSDGIKKSKQRKPTGRITIGLSLNRMNGLMVASIKSTILIMVLITLVIMMGTILAIRRLTQPIMVLTRAHKEVASGNLRFRVPVKRKDEFGTLSKAFNAMAETLEEDSKMLIESNRNLEDKIRERTAELLSREEQLIASESKYRSIFENTGAAMVILEANSIISLVNTEFVKLSGYSKEEVENKRSWTEFIPEKDLEAMKSLPALSILDKEVKSREYEIQLPHKNGLLRDVHITVELNPVTKQRVVSILDITERKQLEGQLVQSRKMEALGTMAGGIAHDFNNILTAIIGFAQITRLKLQQKELDAYLGHILSASERARDLVAQILSFSRQKEKEVGPININPLIKETLKLLRATLPSMIEISLELEAQSPIVLADPTQIHQILMNLCTNSAYSMREKGGLLGIRVDYADVSAKRKGPTQDLKPGKYVRLTVTDTGKGIAPDIIDRIFDPFFTTKKTGEGTGLGLSVVYGVAVKYGGTVTVQSSPGAGAEFRVYLPACESETEAPALTGDHIARGHGRILLVDDEKALADMGKVLLSELGYQVHSMTDSVSALELFRTDPSKFDLVITDMTMPGMTGAVLASELFKIRPDIPIILCTGYSELITEEEAGRSGFRDFLMKPFTLQAIASVVRKALDPA